jgi:hypothetical protein
LAVVAVLAGAGTAGAGAAPLRIYTQWHGTAMRLDVVNGGEFDNFVRLSPAGDFTGQAWTITPDSDGTFRLTTEFRGPKMCLDVIDKGPMDGFLKLTACGNHSGQYWTSADEGGWLRLRPQFRKLCLDVVNGGQLDGFAHMAECGDYSGQHWKIE